MGAKRKKHGWPDAGRTGVAKPPSFRDEPCGRQWQFVIGILAGGPAVKIIGRLYTRAPAGRQAGLHAPPMSRIMARLQCFITEGP
jgi:hypothetical protein